MQKYLKWGGIALLVFGGLFTYITALVIGAVVLLWGRLGDVYGVSLDLTDSAVCPRCQTPTKSKFCPNCGTQVTKTE